MVRKRAFGELELAILAIVRSKKRASVHDVRDALHQENSYTTVMTVMARLVEKGELTREKVGRQYEYVLASQTTSFNLLDRLKQKIFGGKCSLMVSYLIDGDESLSSEELEQMKAIIEKKQKERG